MSVRFNDFRQIQAKFPSLGTCGHAIKKGDRIGYRNRAGVYCTECWDKWKAEVASEEFDLSNNFCEGD